MNSNFPSVGHSVHNGQLSLHNGQLYDWVGQCLSLTDILRPGLWTVLEMFFVPLGVLAPKPSLCFGREESSNLSMCPAERELILNNHGFNADAVCLFSILEFFMVNSVRVLGRKGEQRKKFQGESEGIFESV